MRKLNTILSVLLLFICLLHGLMGSFMLLGISSGAGKFLAWIGVGILAAHTVLGLLLTAQTFRASRSGGKLYGKQNALFWARRTSGGTKEGSPVRVRHGHTCDSFLNKTFVVEG